MVTLQSFRDSVISGLGMGRKPPSLPVLRELCYELLSDVPASDRKAMLQSLERLRRADDMVHLRTAIFTTVAREHGESVARARLARLDEQLR
jgi:hypothetical protein